MYILKPKKPWSSFPCFLDFLAFLLSKEFLAFSCVLPFFPKDFRGSASIKKSLLFWWFSLPFPKSKEKKIREDHAKVPANFRQNFPAKNQKNHRQASAGAQGRRASCGRGCPEILLTYHGRFAPRGLLEKGSVQRCPVELERGEKTPAPQDFSFTKKTARFTKGQFRPY